MPFALLRKATADLKTYRLQGALIFLIVAATALALGFTVRRSASATWDRTFQQSNGAHVWFWGIPGAEIGQIGALEGVTAVTGPFPTVRATVPNGERGVPLNVYGVPVALPEVGGPLVREGRWLTGGAVDEVVLDPRVARALEGAVGDRVELQHAAGAHPLTVVGLAVTSGRAAYPSWSPGLAYVLPETLALLQPDAARWGSALGVRLADPKATDAFIARAEQTLPRGAINLPVSWQRVRGEMSTANQVNVLILTVFSAFALLASALIIANAIGGRVLSQFREIGMLKAVGFTPGAVMLLLLLE